MKQVTINEDVFFTGFGRDMGADAYPRNFYLDLESGNIIIVWDKDDHSSCEGQPEDANRANRASVAASPKRYVLMPGCTHGQHHKILQAFLDSDWTDDEHRKAAASAMYNNSIGSWVRDVNEDTLEGFRDFRTQAIGTMATAFFKEHSINFKWELPF
jgi:hypothetical protein